MAFGAVCRLEVFLLLRNHYFSTP